MGESLSLHTPEEQTPHVPEFHIPFSACLATIQLIGPENTLWVVADLLSDARIRDALMQVPFPGVHESVQMSKIKTCEKLLRIAGGCAKPNDDLFVLNPPSLHAGLALIHNYLHIYPKSHPFMGLRGGQHEKQVDTRIGVLNAVYHGELQSFATSARNRADNVIRISQSAGLLTLPPSITLGAETTPRTRENLNEATLTEAGSVLYGNLMTLYAAYTKELNAP